MKARYYARVSFGKLGEEKAAPLAEKGGMISAADLNRAFEERFGLKPRKERGVMSK